MESMKGKKVIVRTYSAGVHVGVFDAVIKGSGGKRVRLRDARRIWRWRGANTLNEVATRGVESAEKSGYTRVSEPVPLVSLTEAIETIPVTDAAWDAI